MDFKIILSPRAILDLQEIVRYISRDSPVHGEKFGYLLIQKTRVLASFPEIGRKVPEFGDSGIREVIFKSYRIVYRVNSEKRIVEVSRFWHAARGTVIFA